MPPVSTVLILGGGVIGLSLAWQLRRRGFAVTVTDPAFALPPGLAGFSGPSRLPGPGASYAAAGMLAVEDPYNPPQLLALSRLSRSLYDDFLADIGEISGQPVPFQTHTTWQSRPDGEVVELSEQSLDPRQLVPALRAAVGRLGATLTAEPFRKNPPFDAVIYTAGAWTAVRYNTDDRENLPVSPRKGQMLRVRVPPSLHLREVHRSEHVYVVPRLYGPQAGTALVGATVEDAGFDPTLSPEALHTLRTRAAALLPALADEALTPAVEAWAGFRPSTPDALPLLGDLAPVSDPASGSGPADASRQLVATGHYRNGILLAPATAVVLADLLQGRTPQISIEPFAPNRFLQKQ